MNTMNYHGYAARVEFDPRDNIFVGHLIGIADLVSFHGEAVAELRAAFEESVDDYIETCRKVGKKPERPAGGKILLRLPPELHASAMRAAELKGESLNQWATDALRRAV